MEEMRKCKTGKGNESPIKKYYLTIYYRIPTHNGEFNYLESIQRAAFAGLKMDQMISREMFITRV